MRASPLSVVYTKFFFSCPGSDDKPSLARTPTLDLVKRHLPLDACLSGIARAVELLPLGRAVEQRHAVVFVRQSIRVIEVRRSSSVPDLMRLLASVALNSPFLLVSVS